MITVHHLNRSRSHRVLWLLEELDLDYQVIRYERDAKTSLAPPELLKVHPLGKSPVVEIEGETVIESAAIIELICSRHAPNMIPLRTTPEFIRHIELMHYAEGSAMTPILLNLYVGMLAEAGAPLHPRIQQQLTSHFSYMNSQLRASGHFVLDHLSAADILLSFPAEIAIRMGRGEDFPALASFVEAFQNRPAYQRAFVRGGGA
ncbi:glutathione S-transferase [Parasedimentitalea marina]|uniref:glutathione transferase n=1 Tax=Parasedimentitalea marina TaxID=2483033 RepID=A0A3T0N466_9RHOB|nr:glutathione S-transferase [Parasedimentitalea marina]AZV78826.1 glutathione S-transferase [Parasedimentitalea marina]